MSQGLEILIFALIAGYVFYRLWSVLGQNSASERHLKKVNSIIKAVDPEDNVIVLPSRQPQFIEGAELLSERAERGLKLLLQHQPKFDLNHFLNGAQAAFCMIVQAFAEVDRDTLKSLLSDKVYKQFAKVLDKREKDQLTIESHVDNLRISRIEDIFITKGVTNIMLRFESEQITVTIDSAGEIHDNPARLSVTMNDVWTFTRKLDAENPNWVLSATRTE